ATKGTAKWLHYYLNRSKGTPRYSIRIILATRQTKPKGEIDANMRDWPCSDDDTGVDRAKAADRS
ncbi:MAG: hypothetical protein KJ072_19735, partial [Verrucomicrobia bacterium]|nr:hypothetical protein [Verrucomicrobiota bacterium]